MSDFGQIYEENGKVVYYYLLSLCRDKNLAEELTQETMCRAIMNIESFRGESKISVWLCQIAKNLYFEWQNKNKRNVPLDESMRTELQARDTYLFGFYGYWREYSFIRGSFGKRVFGDARF